MLLELGVTWGIVSLIFGILVIVFPNLLSYLVGAYFIIIGLVTIIRGIF